MPDRTGQANGTDPYTAAVNLSTRMTNVQWASLFAAVTLGYVVLVGGTTAGELDPALRLVNAGIGGALVVAYLLRAPDGADRIDRAVLIALLLFAAAAVLSRYPRQSFDAVLAALTYAAALFVARDLLAGEQARRIFGRTLIALSGIITITAAVRWLPLVAEWWALNDWAVIPPLDLALPSGRLGHRHDLALLIAMLYPSWWIGRPGPIRIGIASVIGFVAFLLVIVDGSRTVWLALGVATAVIAAPMVVRRIRRGRRAPLYVLGTVAAATVIALATGLAGTFLDRALNFNTVSYRSAMWGPLTESWIAQPLAGSGPGGFPWILQQTGYFDTNTWAPRHPDSVIFQLLPEAGLLGLAAVLCLSFTLMPGVFRGGSAAARWSLIAFATAGIGMNPTDFAFLIAVALGWAAYALPRAVDVNLPARRTKARVVNAVAFAAIGVAYLATLGAATMYARAAEAIQQADFDEAEQRLTLAIGLDPGMALYWRERGTLSLVGGNAKGAVSDLDRAARINPSDDLALRTLALALRDSDATDRASNSLDMAIEAQRSDPTNMLLRAQWALSDDRDAEALNTLGEIVQAWPAIVAAPGWDAMLSSSDMTTADVVAEAIDRWERKLTAPDGNLALLAVIAHRNDVLERLRWETGADSIQARAANSYRCSNDSPGSVDSVSDTDRRTPSFWDSALRESAWRGSSDPRVTRIRAIMSGGTIDLADADRTLDPLGHYDPNGFSADAWGYRRPPIAWPPFPLQLPSPGAGALRWLIEPAAASEASGAGGSSDCLPGSP